MFIIYFLPDFVSPGTPFILSRICLRKASTPANARLDLLPMRPVSRRAARLSAPRLISRLQVDQNLIFPAIIFGNRVYQKRWQGTYGSGCALKKSHITSVALIACEVMAFGMTVEPGQECP